MRSHHWIEMMKQTATWLAVFLIVNPALTVPAFAQVDIQGAAIESGDVQVGGSPIAGDISGATVDMNQTTPNAVVNYSQFDIGDGGTVNIVQPDAAARLLNRITSPTASATMIDGALNANGIVYFVNSAGVLFGAHAMIDVGQLFAAAGNMSTPDFLAGTNQFTEVNGPIENLGSITGDQVHLVGENVTIGAAGTINVPGTATGSIVTMVAGDDVIITVTGSNVAIVLNDALAGNPTGTGIEQAGTVSAGDGSVNMAVGDLYSMAINHPGSTSADTIVADGTLSTTTSASTMDLAGLTAGAGGIEVHSAGTISLANGAIDSAGAATLTTSSVTHDIASAGGSEDDGIAEITAPSVTLDSSGDIDVDLSTTDIDAVTRNLLDIDNDASAAVTVTRLQSGFTDGLTFHQTGGADADVSLLDVSTLNLGSGGAPSAGSAPITVTTDGGDISVDGTVATGSHTATDGPATSGSVSLTAGGDGQILGAGTVSTGDADADDPTFTATVGSIALQGNKIAETSGATAQATSGNALAVEFGTAAAVDGPGSQIAGTLSAATDGGAGDDGAIVVEAINGSDLVIENGGVNSGAGGDVALLADGEIRGALAADGTAEVTSIAEYSVDLAASGNIDLEVQGVAGPATDSTLEVGVDGANAVVTEVGEAGFDTLSIEASGTDAFYQVDLVGDGSQFATESGGVVTVGAGNVDLTANDRNFSLSNTGGTELEDGAIAAGAGTVSIDDEGGIASAAGAGDNGIAEITAATVDLTTSSNNHDIDVDLASQDISADTAGGIDINNDSATAVTVTRLRSASGDVAFDQTGGDDADVTLLDVSSNPINGPSVTTRDVTITTDGGDIVVDGSVRTGVANGTTDGTSGAVNLTAGGAGVIVGTGTVSTGDANASTGGGTATVGDINLNADTIGTGTNDRLTVGFGTPDSNGGTDVVGALNVQDDDGTAASNVFVGSNTDVGVGFVWADGTAAIASANAINDATADAVTDIQAGSVDLDAGLGIGNLERLELETTQLSADTADGGVSLLNDGAGTLTVTSLSNAGTGDVGLSHTGGGTTILQSASAANSSVLIQNLGVTDPGLTGVLLNGTVSAGDTVQIESSARIADLNDAGQINAPNVDLNAETGITGEIDLSSQKISADTTTGRINLNNNSAAATTVSSLSTGTGLTTDAGTIRFDQTGGGSVTFESAVTDTTSTTEGQGDITLTNTGGPLTATSVTAGGEGDVTVLTIGSGGVTVDQIAALGNNAKVDSAGSILATGSTPDIAAQSVDLDAQTDIGGGGILGLVTETAVLTADSASGSIDIANQTAGDLQVNSLTTTGGSFISLRQSTGGSVLLADGSVSAGTGQVSISVADGGALNAAAATDSAEITADGNVSLSATGIGDVEQIDIAGSVADDSGTLSLETFDTGNVDVEVLNNAFGAFAVTSNGAAGHKIDVTLPGSDVIDLTNDGATLLLSQVDLDEDAGGNGGDSFSATTDTVDMAVGDIVAGSGAVSLTSAGAIDDDDDDSGAPVIDISAASVALDAQTGVGDSLPLELATPLVSATTVDGDIDLDNTASGPVTVTDLSTTGPDGGSIFFEQLGGAAADVTFQAASTADQPDGDPSGHIGLTTDGGDVVVAGDIATGDSTAADGDSGSIEILAGGDGTIYGTGHLITGDADDQVGSMGLEANKVSRSSGPLAEDHLAVTFGTGASHGELLVTTDGGAGSTGGIYVEGVDSDLWIANGGIDSGTGGTVDLIASGTINASDGGDGEAEITSSASYDVRLTADGISGPLQIHGEGPQSDEKTLTITSTGPGDINVDEIDNVMFDNLVVDAQTQDDKDYTIGLIGDGYQEFSYENGTADNGRMFIGSGGIDMSENDRNLETTQQALVNQESAIVIEGTDPDDEGAPGINTGAGNVDLTGIDSAINGTLGTGPGGDGIAEIASTGNVDLTGDGIGNVDRVEILGSDDDNQTFTALVKDGDDMHVGVLSNVYDFFDITSEGSRAQSLEVSLPGGNDQINVSRAAANGSFQLTNVTTANDVNSDLSPGGTGDDVSITVRDTSIAVGEVDVGDARLILESENGSIDDLTQDFDGIIDIDARELLMIATTGIGANRALETRVGLLAAETDAGSVRLHNTGDLEIGTVSGIADGDEIERVGVQIDPDQTAPNDGSAEVLISVGSSLDVNSPIVDNVGGGITLSATDDVTFGANGDLSAPVGGDIVVTADSDNAPTGNGGALTMDAGTSITASTGQIDLRSDEDLTVGRVETGRPGASAVTLISKSGAVLDGRDIAGPDVVAVGGGLTIDAADGVGPDGNALDTQVAFLDGIDGGSGDINLSEADGLTVRQIVQTDEGDIDIAAGDSVVFLPAGDMTTGVGAGDVSVSTQSGAIEMADGSVISSGIGTISLDAAGNVELGSLASENDTENAVHISAGGGVFDAGDTDTDVIAADGRLVIESGAGVGPNDAIDTTVASLVVVNESGDVNIAETDDLEVGALFNNGTGNASVSTENGDLRLFGDGAFAQEGNISLQAGGGQSLRVDAHITADDGNVNLLADDDVLFSAPGDVSAQGDVTVIADADNQPDGEGGAVTMANGTVIDAGSGTIAVSADEDITVGQLITDSASADAVSLTSTSGAIVDGGNAGGADVVAAGGRLVIDAQTGVGDGDAIETQVALLDVQNATSGDVAIREADGLGITGIAQAGPGDVDVRSGDGLVTALVTSAGGDISLTTDSADLDVNDQILSNGGDVALTATNGNVSFGPGGTVGTSGGDAALVAGAAVLGGNDLTVDVNTGTGALTIQSALGVEGLETTVASLDVQNSTSGGVEIIETDGVFVDRIAQSATGDVDLVAGGDISLGSIDAAGDVDLDSGGAIVDGGDAETDVVADALNMVAANGIGAANPIDVDVNTLTASIDGFGGSAPIRVSEANDVSVGDVSTAFLGTGPIEIDANGTMTVTGFVNSADGTIDLSAGDDLNFAATGRTSSGNGDTVLTADADGTGGGGITMDAQSSATAGFATITLQATDDITVANLNAGTEVSVTSDAGGIVDGGDVGVDIGATTATLRAATGIGSGNALELAVGTLDAENSTSGNIELSELDALTVNNLVQGGPGATTVSAGSTLTVAGSGVSATTGQVTLSGSPVNVNAGINTTGGGVGISSGSNLNFAAAGDVSTQGGDVQAVATGAIAMADGAVVNAGDGTISFDANGGNISLGRLVTTNASSGAVSLETSGAVLDGGDAEGVDVEAVNGRLTIDSVTGVGTPANPLDVNVAELDVSNTGSGSVNVNESDSVSVVQIFNPGDPVNFSAGGDILLGSITGSTVTLGSSGGGVFDQDGDDRNIDADLLVFDVATGFGTQGDPIDTRVADFDGRTTTGDISIENDRDFGATITELVSGTGNVWFQQNHEDGAQQIPDGETGGGGGEGGDLIVHHVDAGSDGTAATGNITLENTSGRVVLKQDVLARGWGDLTLSGNAQNDYEESDDVIIDVVMDAPEEVLEDFTFKSQTIGSEQGDLVIIGDGVEKTNSGDMKLTGDTIELMPLDSSRASQAPGSVVEDLFAGTGSYEGDTTQHIIHHQKGDIDLNVGRGRPAGGETPTVVAHGDLYVQDFIGGLNSEENEVIVANGDVEIRVENDVQLPDTAAAGDIFVRTRTGLVYLLDDATSASFLTPNDRPMNYVADTIELDGAERGEQPRFPPGNPGLNDNRKRPIFATTNGLPGVDPDTRAVVLTYDTDYDPREARLTGATFPPFDAPIPPERDPATEIQAELGALMADELQSPVPGADVAAQRPLWADEVLAYMECGLTPQAGSCVNKDPRLQSQAAVNARELYRRLFENEAGIRIWFQAEPQGPEAMHYRKGLEELFGYTGELLSDEEQVRLRRMVLRLVAPEGTSDEDLDEMLQ